MAFDFIYLIAAFGGGVFGAAIGGLFAFILTGVCAVVGAGILLATGDATFNNVIAYGPVLSPAISFAGGAAAAVYAFSRGKLANGRDIGTCLISLKSPDVLLVGGVFGVLGYVLLWGFSQIPNIGDMPWTNTTALTVMVNAIIARLVFGKTGVFGKVRHGDNRWRASEVANWLPWQTDPMTLLIVGLGFGLAVSYTIIQAPGLAGVWFGVSAFALVLLQFGASAPVWHHIVLAAEQAIALGGGDIWWGVTFAIIGAFLGEIMAMLFTAHADSHIDPPACSLWVTFLLTAIFRQLGVFQIQGIGSLIITVVVGAALYVLVSAMKARPNAAPATAAKPA